MGLFDFLKKRKEEPFVKKTRVAFARINLYDFFNFLARTKLHYKVEQNRVEGFLGKTKQEKIDDIQSIIDSLDWVMGKNENFVELQLVNGSEIIVKDDVSIWNWEINSVDLLTYIEFEVMELSILKEKYKEENNIVKFNSCCDEINVVKEAWKFLNSYKSEFNHQFMESKVYLEVSSTY